MDFFTSQDLAHRKTKWLIGYFALAVLGIIATLHVLAALAFKESLTDWRLLGMISVGVVAVVALGAAYRIAELSQGGRVVAEMLGGRRSRRTRQTSRSSSSATSSRKWRSPRACPCRTSMCSMRRRRSTPSQPETRPATPWSR